MFEICEKRQQSIWLSIQFGHQSCSAWFSKADFESFFTIIDSHTRVWAYFSNMDKPKEPITSGGSREAWGVAIAPDRAEQTTQRPRRVVWDKGKRKVAEHKDSNSDDGRSLNVTWMTLEYEQEGSKTPTRGPTLESSPKWRQSKARSKVHHDYLLQICQII